MAVRVRNRVRRTRDLIQGLEQRILFSFGVTTSGSSLIVDTGAALVFTVSSTNGDLTSIKYNGQELEAPYSLTGRYSHYESGLSSTNTTVTSTVNSSQGWIKIACTDSGLGVTQYYVARKGYNNIYMATYAGGSTAPSPGEMRFITYLNRSIFTNHNPYSDINGMTAIEGSDVYANTSTGYTASKFYSSRRNIDDRYHGDTGSGVGAFMMIGSREKGSGGPFFKDIAEQGTSSAIELYNYMYSGHEQTEAYRSGLQAPYALEFTNGSQPAALDYSFMDNVGITGWVAASGRGAIGGDAVGYPTGPAVTIGLSNANAQYWGTAGSTGGYHIGGILPGTYTETMYSGELAIGSQTVTISAGATTNVNIHTSLTQPTPIWRIGTWDGTPLEFRNEPALNTEHPSDSRMQSWSNVRYTVGSSSTNVWPTAQWKDVNNNSEIVFSLTSAQISAGVTLRIGITDSFAGGRPYIVVNSGLSYSWTSALPAAPSEPNSRSITRGTYRGNNEVFTYTIPSGNLRTGTNNIHVIVNSGSSGTGFLSPAIVYDAIDLVPTSSVSTATAAVKTATAAVVATVPAKKEHHGQGAIAQKKRAHGHGARAHASRSEARRHW